MSRIGKKPIALPQGVTVDITNDVVTVKGPKGQLQAPVLAGLSVTIEDGEVVVKQVKASRESSAFHGLVRSLIANHVVGVTDGYKKTLKLVGTG